MNNRLVNVRENIVSIWHVIGIGSMVSAMYIPRSAAAASSSTMPETRCRRIRRERAT